MPDAAAREPLGVTCDHAGGYEYWCSECQPSARELQEHIAAERKRTRRLEEALERLANPTHTPKTEEAALLQIEVEQIARAALDA